MRNVVSRPKAELMDQVKALSSKPLPPSAPTPTAVSAPFKPTQDDYHTSIWKEVQEMNKSEKHCSSIIVKGLSAKSLRYQRFQAS